MSTYYSLVVRSVAASHLVMSKTVLELAYLATKLYNTLCGCYEAMDPCMASVDVGCGLSTGEMIISRLATMYVRKMWLPESFIPTAATKNLPGAFCVARTIQVMKARFRDKNTPEN